MGLHEPHIAQALLPELRRLHGREGRAPGDITPPAAVAAEHEVHPRRRLRANQDQRASRGEQRSGRFNRAHRLTQRAEIECDDDQLPVARGRCFIQQAQIERRESLLQAPRLVKPARFGAEKSVIRAIEIQSLAQDRGERRRARADLGQAHAATLGQSADCSGELHAQTDADTACELSAEHLPQQRGWGDLARPDIGQGRLSVPKHRQMCADAANRVSNVKVIGIIADQAVPDVLRFLRRIAGARSLQQAVRLCEIEQLLPVDRRGWHMTRRGFARERFNNEASAQRIEQRIDFAGILILSPPDLRVREAGCKSRIQRFFRQFVVGKFGCAEWPRNCPVFQVAQLLRAVALQADAAEAHVFEQRDRLPRFVENLELAADRMGRPRQYAGARIFRRTHSTSIAQMAYAGRHECQALVTGNLVAHQLDNQLEGVIQQRRMQVMLLYLGLYACRQFEHREDRRAIDPAVFDRLEGRAIIEARAHGQQGVAACGEVRLARRQLIERPRQAQRCCIAQHACNRLQGPHAARGILSGLYRQLAIARIQRTAHRTGRLFGEQKRGENFQILDLGAALRLPADGSGEGEFGISRARKDRGVANDMIAEDGVTQGVERAFPGQFRLIQCGAEQRVGAGVVQQTGRCAGNRMPMAFALPWIVRQGNKSALPGQKALPVDLCAGDQRLRSG